MKAKKNQQISKPCRPVKVVRVFCGTRTAEELVTDLLKAHAA